MLRAGLTNPWHECPKKTGGNTSLARGTYCCPFSFYFFCPTSDSILRKIHVHILSDCAKTVYELHMLLYNTAREIFLHKSGSGGKCWLDIYHWSAGLAVTWRMRDIGQNVLKSYHTGSSSSESYLHTFLLFEFLEEAFIRNINNHTMY